MKPTFLMFLVDFIVTLQSQLELKVNFQINCWTFPPLEGMSNTKFTWIQFVCQLVYLTFVNESSIIVNSLKFVNIQLSICMDITRFYPSMFGLVYTNINIEMECCKSHPWTWMALISPLSVTRKTCTKFLKDITLGGQNHCKVKI